MQGNKRHAVAEVQHERRGNKADVFYSFSPFSSIIRVIFSTLQTTHRISPDQVRMSSSSYKYGPFFTDIKQNNTNSLFLPVLVWVFIFLWTSLDILKSGHVSAVKVTHLALYLPGLGDGWQVTTCHHHGPEGVRQTHSQRDKEKRKQDMQHADDLPWPAVSEISSNIVSKVNWTDVSQHVKSLYIHDDFLPDGVVGNISRGLFFVCHWLRGIHDVLEHGSLSVWRVTGHINWAAFLQLLRARLRLAVLLRLALTVAANLLEVKRQICGDDADVEQVLHILKLTLLEVAEDVQALREIIVIKRLCFSFLNITTEITGQEENAVPPPPLESCCTPNGVSPWWRSHEVWPEEMHSYRGEKKTLFRHGSIYCQTRS